MNKKLPLMVANVRKQGIVKKTLLTAALSVVAGNLLAGNDYDIAEKMKSSASSGSVSLIDQIKARELNKATSSALESRPQTGRDSTSYGDRYTTVTTYNEEAKAYDKAIADSNNYTDALRQEIASGSLANSSNAPSDLRDKLKNVRKIYKRWPNDRSYFACSFSYNKDTKKATMSGEWYDSRGRRRGVVSHTFTVSSTLAGYESKTNRETYYNWPQTVTYQNGVLSCVQRSSYSWEKRQRVWREYPTPKYNLAD